MCLRKSLDDFCADLQNLINRHRTFLQAICKGLALQKLHDQKIRAALRADVVKGADVGMLQRGNRFGFPLQTLF
jgi:hypothetical protein